MKKTRDEVNSLKLERDDLKAGNLKNSLSVTVLKENKMPNGLKTIHVIFDKKVIRVRKIKKLQYWRNYLFLRKEILNIFYFISLVSCITLLGTYLSNV